MIKKAFLSLTDKDPEGTAILKSIDPHYTGFIEASDEDYVEIREIMSALDLS